MMLRRSGGEGGVGIVRRKKLRAGGGTDDGYIGTVDVKRYNFYSLFFH